MKNQRFILHVNLDGRGNRKEGTTKDYQINNYSSSTTLSHIETHPESSFEDNLCFSQYLFTLSLRFCESLAWNEQRKTGHCLSDPFLLAHLAEAES